ncbi:C2H2-like zinc finger protein [Actinidia rufa]|uniref:C2H2-like zinc finger protein n=1 Tax=Actinidia rufa TaxID=165716 RepID=A0A7J0DQ96_9ERIC|nr:C2H2-like zinc finger protein [Actinidia rufa]
MLMKYIVPEKEVEQLGKLLRRAITCTYGLQYLMPFVEQEKYEISRKCRLHPDFDIFRDQEQHKIHVDVNEWRCGYCKKVFRAEKFLDQHFDNRHNDLLNVNQSKCLADVCGALHCDLVMDTNLKFRKTKCNTAAAARNHHLCESLADSCFPMNQSPSANRLHGTLLNFKKTMLCLQFFWRTKTLFQREAEAYKHSLLGSFNIDLDVPPYLLSYRLFVPERKEKRNPSVEAHLTTWTKTKALLVGYGENGCLSLLLQHDLRSPITSVVVEYK